MQCIVSRVRPASVDKILTLFIDRSSQNIENSLPVRKEKKDFLSNYYNLNILDIAYNLKLDFFILTTSVYSDELLTDFSYTNFNVSYRDALDSSMFTCVLL